MIIEPFADNSQCSFKGVGTHFNATANTDTTYLYTIPFDCFINGMEILSYSNIGEWITVQVLDSPNFFGYGTDFLLSEFAKEWRLLTDQHLSADLALNYAARLITGQKIKFIYHNTSLLDSKRVDINLYLHKSNRAFTLKDFGL